MDMDENQNPQTDEDMNSNEEQNDTQENSSAERITPAPEGEPDEI